jgi:hypothetical protein
MADVAKLRKHFEKKVFEADTARGALDAAILDFGKAREAVATAAAELEHEETLEMARELRAKK